MVLAAHGDYPRPGKEPPREGSLTSIVSFFLPYYHSDLHPVGRLKRGTEERVDREELDSLSSHLLERGQRLALHGRYLHQRGARLELRCDFLGHFEGALHRDRDYRDVASLHGFRVRLVEGEPSPAFLGILANLAK